MGLTLVWSNRQRTVPASRAGLAKAAAVAARALPDVLGSCRAGCVLPSLEEVHFVVVSDRKIAALHAEFLSDPTPTDVITFLHGEVVLSAETALREARRHRLPVAEEVARYAVHGLLHLAGWDDSDRDAASEMRAVQEKILRRATRGLC